MLNKTNTKVELHNDQLEVHTNTLSDLDSRTSTGDKVVNPENISVNNSLKPSVDKPRPGSGDIFANDLEMNKEFFG